MYWHNGKEIRKLTAQEMRMAEEYRAAGMTEEQLARLQSGSYEEHHSGLGLKNVHQRIRLYCGEPYGLSFESAQGLGTTVTVLLPRRGVDQLYREGAEP